MNKTADAVVVGGGAVGTAITYFLSKSVLDVALVEKGGIAAGVLAKEIGKIAGLDLPIEPRQGQLLVGERSFPLGKRKLQEFGYMMSKFDRTDYQRQPN